MNLLFEIKNILDEKLEENIINSGIVLGGCFIITLILDFISKAIWTNIGFSIMWFALLYNIVFTLFIFLETLVMGYVVYFNVVQKKLFVIKNKYISFLIAYTGVYIVFWLLDYLIMGYDVLGVFTSLLGVPLFFEYLGNLFSSILYFTDFVYYYNFLYAFFTILSNVIHLVFSLQNVFVVGGLMLLEYKYPTVLNGQYMGDEELMIDELEDIEEVVQVQEIIEQTETYNEESCELSRNAIDLYLTLNKRYFGNDKVGILHDKLVKMNEVDFMKLMSVEFEDPAKMLIISLVLGTFGIDRFMMGEIGMGILKLLTAGCCGILTIIDWFTISKKVKEKNIKKLLEL